MLDRRVGIYIGSDNGNGQEILVEDNDGYAETGDIRDLVHMLCRLALKSTLSLFVAKYKPR